MRDRTASQADRAIMDSRTAVEASRHHIAGIVRRLRDGQAFAEAMRRDLDQWRRELR